MRTWVERVSAGPGFAGREGNHLDRFKAMRRDGWDVSLVIDGSEIVCVARYRGPEYVALWTPVERRLPALD